MEIIIQEEKDKNNNNRLSASTEIHIQGNSLEMLYTLLNTCYYDIQQCLMNKEFNNTNNIILVQVKKNLYKLGKKTRL